MGNSASRKTETVSSASKKMRAGRKKQPPARFPQAALHSTFVTLLFRITDYQRVDERCFPRLNKTRGIFGVDDRKAFDHRVGRIHLLDVEHLNNVRMHFDLTAFEDRLIVRLMMLIAWKEGGGGKGSGMDEH